MKEGDMLIQKLKQAARKRDQLAVIAFSVKYDMPWYYWLDWQRANKN